jgi:hypothetical protein
MRTPDARRSRPLGLGYTHGQHSTKLCSCKQRAGSTARRHQPTDVQDERHDNRVTFRFRAAHGADGTRHDVSHFKRNGRRQVDVAHVPDFIDETARERERVEKYWAARRLRRQKANLLERYRREGQCTLTQLETIKALLLDGLSLQEHARRERVSPAAISSRIARLEKTASVFHRWWTACHRARRDAAKNSHARRRTQR